MGICAYRFFRAAISGGVIVIDLVFIILQYVIYVVLSIKEVYFLLKDFIGVFCIEVEVSFVYCGNLQR